MESPNGHYQQSNSDENTLLTTSTGLKSGMEVQLTLLEGRDDLPQRTFTLTPTSKPMTIGRSSKSALKQLIAAKDNCWIDNPVISRDHAKLVVEQAKVGNVSELNTTAERGTDGCSKSVRLFIQDTGSMHGTFVNGKGIPSRFDTHLLSGDTVQFGTNVTRGDGKPHVTTSDYHDANTDWSDIFRAPKYEVSCSTLKSEQEHFSSASQPVVHSSPFAMSQNGRSGFYVPDSDDSDDSRAPSVISVDSDQDEADDSDSSAPIVISTIRKQSRVASPDVEGTMSHRESLLSIANRILVVSSTGVKPIEIEEVDNVPETVIVKEADSDSVVDLDEDENEDEEDDMASADRQSPFHNATLLNLMSDDDDVSSDDEDYMPQSPSVGRRHNSLSDNGSEIGSAAADIDSDSDSDDESVPDAETSPDIAPYHPSDPSLSSLSASKEKSSMSGLLESRPPPALPQKLSMEDLILRESPVEAPAPMRKLKIGDMLNDKHNEIVSPKDSIRPTFIGQEDWPPSLYYQAPPPIQFSPLPPIIGTETIPPRPSFYSVLPGEMPHGEPCYRPEPQFHPMHGPSYLTSETAMSVPDMDVYSGPSDTANDFRDAFMTPAPWSIPPAHERVRRPSKLRHSLFQADSPDVEPAQDTSCGAEEVFHPIRPMDNVMVEPAVKPTPPQGSFAIKSKKRSFDIFSRDTSAMPESVAPKEPKNIEKSASDHGNAVAEENYIVNNEELNRVISDALERGSAFEANFQAASVQPAQADATAAPAGVEHNAEQTAPEAVPETSEEPPRKRARSSFATKAAYAVGGAVAGSVGMLLGLAAIPENFF